MQSGEPVLHMLCGKIASGKSTLCAQLARAPSTIVIAQDAWMAELYREELATVADYIRLVPRLRAALGPHIVALLRLGISVVLDWPANTTASRAWMRGLFESAGAGHQLHVLDVPDAICLERLRQRSQSGTHAFKVDQADFDKITSMFEPPDAGERLVITLHSWG